MTQLKPQISLKHVQSFFSEWKTKGRLSSLSSHRSSIPPQSSPELFLEPEKDVESAVSLVLQSQAMMQTDGFEYLKKNCPTILIEILEYVARVSEHFVIQHQHGNEA